MPLLSESAFSLSHLLLKEFTLVLQNTEGQSGKNRKEDRWCVCESGRRDHYRSGSLILTHLFFFFLTLGLCTTLKRREKGKENVIVFVRVTDKNVSTAAS